MREWGIGVAIAAALAGCDAPVPVDPAPIAVELDARAQWLGSAQLRRTTAERTLTNHENVYSRERLASWALPEGGWEALPVWNPRAVPLTRAHVESLRRGETLQLPADVAPFDLAWTDDALGRRAFFELPLRADEFIEHALRDDAFAAGVGLHRDRDDVYSGLVVFADIDGRTRVGITCALCHSTVRNGEAVAGLARRDFDYGRVRLAYHDATGAPLEPELRTRMASWGPGRADITGDDDEDPVAIPDLWRLGELDAYTQAGTLHVDPSHAESLADQRMFLLAFRQETQIVQANSERTRPPREIAWALAHAILDLQPARAEPRDPELAARGHGLFTTHCVGCHHGSSGSGVTVAADRVGTDDALAFSRARGTGRFRPSPLVGVRDAAPYFHDGTVPTLAGVLDPMRLRDDYISGARGPGAVRGHAFGTQLPADDRAALVAYLETW